MGSEQLFDSWPDKYRQWFETPIGKLVKEREQRLIMDLLQPRSGELILDAGCGSGIFTRPFIEAGVDVVGLDVSEPMLRYARHALPRESFYPLMGDMRALPFPDAVFDRSVSVTALEFIEEAQTAVDELFRVTRSGGSVVVATLNSLSPWAERRSAEANQDASSVFNYTYFRSPDDLRGLSNITATVRSAVHFAKDDELETATHLERQGEEEGRESGAFVIAQWTKA